MTHERQYSTATDLYLVRIWRGKLGDGAPGLHGKLQHVVSGASCCFDALSDLPQALEQMIGQASGSLGPDTESLLNQEPEARLED